jgi:hypothetical protein
MKLVLALFIFTLNLAYAGPLTLKDTLSVLGTPNLVNGDSRFYSESNFQEWKSSFEDDRRIETELLKYNYKGLKLPNPYIDELTTELREKIFTEQLEWSKRAGCLSEAKGKFLTHGQVFNRGVYPVVEESAIRNFENGFIRIEASGCINSNSVIKVLNEYLKSDFQIQAISELKSTVIQNDLVCETTKVFSVGTSKYCYDVKINNQKDKGIISLHTYNLFNAPVKEADAPVYFRELLLSFKQVSPGKIAAHVIVYVRGPEISGMVKGIAQSRIESTQNKLFELLNNSVK